MTNTQRDARSIRGAIRQCESLSDEYQMALAKLKISMLSARSNPDIAPHAGQRAFIRLGHVEKALQEASNNLARTHDELSAIAITMGPDHAPTIDSPMADGTGVFDVPVARELEGSGSAKI